MARLNARPSHTSTAATSRYGSETPAPGRESDQENHDPDVQRMDKGKGRAADVPPQRSSLPTPTSDASTEARGQKRKRVEIQSRTQATDGDDDVNEEEARFNRYFDPNQDPEARRQIKKKSRALERDFQENRDDLLRDSGDGLTRTIRQANSIYKEVKQTNDATLDARLLVNVSDLAVKKTDKLVLGDGSTGVDVDEFLSKCITYMRNGGPLDHGEDDVAPSSSRRRRTRNRNDSDDEEADDIIGEPLDWEVLGRHACFPYNSRPCVPSFLLGPLSVEKKQRTQTQRRARQAKDTLGKEARPEALSREDLAQSDENGLTAICTRIKRHLDKHIRTAFNALRDAGINETVTDPAKLRQGEAILKEYHMPSTAGVSLFDYVLNPRSFGQTVENLFYISFLIKEGAFGISNDSEGLPMLVPGEERSVEQRREHNSTRRQAVFALDYATWRELVRAFDIEKPMIPHRQEEISATQVGEKGWYT